MQRLIVLIAGFLVMFVFGTFAATETDLARRYMAILVSLWGLFLVVNVILLPTKDSDE